MLHSEVNCAGCTGCDYLCTSRNRHLWHSWHLHRSWKLGLIRNSLSTAVSGAGINRSQSNHLFSSHLKPVRSPPWHNDVFLMERKVQSILPQMETDVVVRALQSHQAQIYDILNMNIWQPQTSLQKTDGVTKTLFGGSSKVVFCAVQPYCQHLYSDLYSCIDFTEPGSVGLPLEFTEERPSSSYHEVWHLFRKNDTVPTRSVGLTHIHTSPNWVCQVLPLCTVCMSLR